MEALGFDIAEAKRSLDENKHDHPNATYYLIF